MERNITLRKEKKQYWKIEQFVEEIADEYHIFNSYYGNILISLIEIAEADKSSELDIGFISKKKGLIFTVNGNFKEIREDSDLVLLLSTVTDEYKKEDDKIEIVFSVNSINKELSSGRQEKFKDYINKVKTGEKDK